ncbi:MAG: hypothetical protein JWQ84_2699 [Mucilaginibacter sp.]|nr:hypothetical protein [Mucilaginibacter sp.]
MLRSFLIILFVCCFGTILHAQTVFNGRVLENKTRIVLHGVIVENLNNKLKTITGDDGRFSIAAKVGDLLVLRSFSYRPDTLLLTDMHDREIFLLPQTNMLNQVTITDSSGHTSAAAKNMTYYDPMFHGQVLDYQRDENLNYKGGVALRLHYFTKDDRDKKKAGKRAADRKTSEEISKVFTPENISTYVPLKGRDMDDFLLMYIPEVEVYTNKDFNLLTYLNACYKEWLTLPEDKRHAASQVFKH